jgi:hypothetical protein
MKTYTISIGGKTKEQLLKELEDKNIGMSRWAKEIINSPEFKVTPERKEIKIDIITVGELGLEDFSTTEQIFKKAKEKGYSLCSPEVAPELLLQCEDYRGWTILGMEAIEDSGGDPSLLSASRDGDGRWLSAYCGEPGGMWSREGGFAFAVSQDLNTKSLCSFDTLTLEQAVDFITSKGYKVTLEK